MAHTYAIQKSWVDQGRPGVHCGYIIITMADNIAAGVYAIDAEDINSNLSTLYQLTPLGGNIGTADVVIDLQWSYANQDWTPYELATGKIITTATIMDGAAVYCYYEGS